MSFYTSTRRVGALSLHSLRLLLAQPSKSRVSCSSEVAPYLSTMTMQSKEQNSPPLVWLNGCELTPNKTFDSDVSRRFAAARLALASGQSTLRWTARHVLPMFAHTVAVALVCSLLASCGGGGGGDAPPPAASIFVLRMRGLPGSEEFRVTTSSAQVIAQARGQLVLPEAQRRLSPLVQFALAMAVTTRAGAGTSRTYHSLRLPSSCATEDRAWSKQI